MAAFDFFAAARRLARRGEPFATATVVRAERPTSGKPGDRAIVTLDGRLHGWVGGSCTRPTVVDEALAALADGRSRLIRLSREPDDRAAREGITDLSMTCFSGGTMEIFIEPHTPRPRLLIVGSQVLARTLAELGRAVGYEIVAVGPGDELAGADATVAEVDEIGDQVHPLTAVVVASHGDHDEIALERAFAGEPLYVGLVASRKRAASIVEFLEGRGVASEKLALLHAPAGLDIGARRPEEIAVSILAEIVQALSARGRFDWAAGGEAEAAADGAIDPVCGMRVEIAGAPAHEHQRVRYYFCCDGCRTRFAAEPDRYLAHA